VEIPKQFSPQHPWMYASRIVPRCRGFRASPKSQALLENPAKYSPPTPPYYHPERRGPTALSPASPSRTRPFDDFEQSLVFDNFYRGRDKRYQCGKTGMGLSHRQSDRGSAQRAVSGDRPLGRRSSFSFELPTA